MSRGTTDGSPRQKVFKTRAKALPQLLLKTSTLTLIVSALSAAFFLKPAIAQGSRPVRLSPEAEQHWRQGQRLLGTMQPRLALGEFDQALKLAPGNIAILAARGACLMRLKDFEGAYRDFHAALLKSPGQPDLLRLRGTANMCLCEADRAIDDLSQAIAIKPTAQAIFNRATCYIQTARYEKAIDDYTNLIKRRANLYPSLFQRGRVYYLLDEYDKAIVDFSAVIKADPNSALKCYICRGRAFAAKGRTDLALADLKKAVLLDDDYAESFYAPAVESLIESDARLEERPPANEQRSSTGKLKSLSSKQSQSNQEAGDKYLAEALALKEKKQLARALAACNLALKANGRSTTAHVLKGKILMDSGNYKAALACFNQAWTMDNLNLDAVRGRAEANAALGLPQRTLADLGKLVLASPDDPELRFRQAELFDKLKRSKEALAGYLKCLELDHRKELLKNKLGKDKDAYFRIAQATQALSAEQRRKASVRIEILKH